MCIAVFKLYVIQRKFRAAAYFKDTPMIGYVYCTDGRII